MDKAQLISALSEALQTEQVMGALKTNIVLPMIESLENKIGELEKNNNKLQEKITDLESKYVDLKKEINSSKQAHEQEMIAHNNILEKIQKNYNDLKKEVDTRNKVHEQEIKQKNIIVEELKEEENKNPIDQAMDVFKAMGLNINKTDIHQAYRIKQKPKEVKQGEQNDQDVNEKKPEKPRKLMVKFYSTQTKELAYKNRSNLKNTKINECAVYINEDLTLDQSELLYETRKLKGGKGKEKLIHAVWTHNGNVYARQDKEDTPTWIKDLATLKKYREWVSLTKN